ncbi:MAG: transcriptional repressor [Verrucomicrobiales bacterium]|nr:transcriptional repressor [Verrucomicrobiales bacterium]
MVSKLRQDIAAKGESGGGALGGLRMTKQRKLVYDVLLDERDHPTATEVYMRSKQRMSSISLATVYNCLETLSAAGLVKQVNVGRDASRYCPNLAQHAHFICVKCEQVLDIDLKNDKEVESVWELPEGARIDQLEVAMKGVCPDCNAAEKEVGGNG